VKNIFKVFVITAGIVFFCNVNSFAIVDGAVWGGAIFDGTVEGNSSKPSGYEYGAKAHYNTSLIPMIELGIGAYYQDSTIKFDLIKGKDFKRSSLGVDGNLILNIPLFPINPYVRGTYATWDKYDEDVKKFKAYGFGGGLELSIPLLPIRFFGEYMYDHTDHDFILTTSSVNFGVKVSI